MEFLRFRGHLENLNWDSPPPKGRRAELLAGGGPSQRAPCLQEEGQAFTWDDIDGGPPATDDSWAPFTPKDAKNMDGKLQAGGKKLTKEQRQKIKDQEQLAEARESIRKRGWTEGEVKWRSWLARRGQDVCVNDWNLYRYIDGDCIPPSRDPFWLNSNEVPLPDYEAGNDVPNEVGPMEVTTLLGERIEPKYKPARVVQLGPLWAEVDGDDLVARGEQPASPPGPQASWPAQAPPCTMRAALLHAHSHPSCATIPRARRSRPPHRELLLAADAWHGVRGGQGARGHVCARLARDHRADTPLARHRRRAAVLGADPLHEDLRRLRRRQRGVDLGAARQARRRLQPRQVAPPRRRQRARLVAHVVAQVL